MLDVGCWAVTRAVTKIAVAVCESEHSVVGAISYSTFSDATSAAAACRLSLLRTCTRDRHSRSLDRTALSSHAILNGPQLYYH